MPGAGDLTALDQVRHGPNEVGEEVEDGADDGSVLVEIATS